MADEPITSEQPESPDWGGLHESLVGTLTSPDFMEQHPDLPGGDSQFRGDDSVQHYRADVGDAYASAMKEAGVPEELVSKHRKGVEKIAEQRARLYALQKQMAPSEDRGLTENIPLGGHIIKAQRASDWNNATKRLEHGTADAADYRTISRGLGDQADEAQRGWWDRRGRNLLGLGQFAAEIALTGGPAGTAAAGGVARAGGGKLLQYGAFGAASTAAMPQRVLGEYAERQRMQVGLDEKGQLTFVEPESKAASAWKATASSYIDNTVMPGLAGAFTRAGVGTYGQRVLKKTLTALAGVEAAGDTKRLLTVSPQGGPGSQIASALASGDPEKIKHALGEAAGTIVEFGLLEAAVQYRSGGMSEDAAGQRLAQELLKLPGAEKPAEPTKPGTPADVELPPAADVGRPEADDNPPMSEAEKQKFLASVTPADPTQMNPRTQADHLTELVQTAEERVTEARARVEREQGRAEMGLKNELREARKERRAATAEAKVLRQEVQKARDEAFKWEDSERKTQPVEEPPAQPTMQQPAQEGPPTMRQPGEPGQKTMAEPPENLDKTKARSPYQPPPEAEPPKLMPQHDQDLNLVHARLAANQIEGGLLSPEKLQEVGPRMAWALRRVAKALHTGEEVSAKDSAEIRQLMREDPRGDTHEHFRAVLRDAADEARLAEPPDPVAMAKSRLEAAKKGGASKARQNELAQELHDAERAAKPPAETGQQRDLREAAEAKARLGEDLPPDDSPALQAHFEASGLDAREQRVITARLVDKQTHDNIGRKLGLTRARIEQIEAGAMKKLGADFSIDQFNKHTGMLNRAENAQPVDFGELRQTDVDGLEGLAKQRSISENQIEAEATRLADALMKEIQQNGPASPERQAEFQRAIDRLWQGRRPGRPPAIEQPEPVPEANPAPPRAPAPEAAGTKPAVPEHRGDNSPERRQYVNALMKGGFTRAAAEAKGTEKFGFGPSAEKLAAQNRQMEALRGLKSESVLAAAKRRGGISEASARGLWGDDLTDEIKQEIPSVFRGRKGKGRRALDEISNEMAAEGEITVGDEEHAHAVLFDAIKAHSLNMAQNFERQAQRQAKNYAEELHRAQDENPEAASALRQGFADGQAIADRESAQRPSEDAHDALGPEAKGDEGIEEVEPGVFFYQPPSGPGGGKPPPGPGGGPQQPVRGGGRAGGGLIDDIKKLMAPATREGADVGAGILRHKLAEMAQAKERALAALHEGEAHLDQWVVHAPDEATGTARMLDFTDAIEGGDIARLPPELRTIAQAIREQNDIREKQVVDRGLIKSTIENYLGHIWKKPGSTMAPEEIGRALSGRRPLAGSEAYRKHRVFPTIRDGMDAGFEPVDRNPVRLALLKMREVDKSIMAHDTIKELGDNGMWEYVRLGKQAPEGFVQVQDKAARVFAAPEMKQREYFDEKQMEGLEKFAEKLSIPIQTKMGGVVGRSDPSGIVRRFGTPEEILAHEIAHQLDARYLLTKRWLGAQGPMQAELHALADLRVEGHAATPEYAEYLHSGHERIANLFTAYFHAPELLRQTAPESAKVLDAFLVSHPELAELRDIKPSLVLGQREQMQRLAGPMLTGNYYTPEPVARLLNNYLEPGLRGNRAYDAIREMGGVLNNFQLGFGAFHAGFVAVDTSISAAALGVQMVSRGEVLKGLSQIATAPASLVRAWTQGSKLLREYYKPGSQGAETAALMENFKESGGRAGGSSARDVMYAGDHIQAFQRALRAVRAGESGKVGSLLYNALPAVSEYFSRPVMEQLVPRMKMGVWAEMARHELDKNPTMDLNARRQILGKAWDSVENRLGQMTYDNLFWNRTFKDLLMASVRSVGWNVGTIRELGGGIKDIPASLRGIASGEGISPRTAYLVALPLVTGLYGAMVGFMYGQPPQELKDYFFPRTGKTRPDGSADRVSLPSYMRDVAALTNRGEEGPLRVGQNAWSMAKHKANPLTGMVAEMLENEDFYGTALRNPGDPAVQQSLDTAKHFVGAFKPFSIRGYQQQRQSGGVAQALPAFVGVTPAPAYITRAAEQQRDLELKRRSFSTPQEKLRKQKLKGE